MALRSSVACAKNTSARAWVVKDTQFVAVVLGLQTEPRVLHAGKVLEYAFPRAPRRVSQDALLQIEPRRTLHVTDHDWVASVLSQEGRRQDVLYRPVQPAIVGVTSYPPTHEAMIANIF
jgi:hypothetical protein